ncbi:MAG: PepSY-associated TM helix domain-containing protein [Candidatus Hydrogenedentes bacterium]|nr:PepSY-associated TM helix domain-containing protein [Candidatus Hydrogenedentota bacterium]
MPRRTKYRLRRLNIATHRDLGYFFSSLIVAYCISGIALNHVDDWNPDFIVHKQTVRLDRAYTKAEIDDLAIAAFGTLVGEERYKVYDFPTQDQVKIYYDDASLHVYLSEQEGKYERIVRRPVFYQVNVLHRNSLKGWKWASDIFAAMLILINVTGLFILKGKHGIGGRGKWLIAAGFAPPLIAVLIHAFR